MSRSSASDNELSNSIVDSSETDDDERSKMFLERGEKIKTTRKKRTYSPINSSIRKKNLKVIKKTPNATEKSNTTTKKKKQYTSRTPKTNDPNSDNEVSLKKIRDTKNENKPDAHKVSEEKEKHVMKNKNDLSNGKCEIENDEPRGSFVFTGSEVISEKRIRMKRNVKLTTIVSGMSKYDLASLVCTINDDYTVFFGKKTHSKDVYIQIHFHQDCYIEQEDVLAICVK